MMCKTIPTIVNFLDKVDIIFCCIHNMEHVVLNVQFGLNSGISKHFTQPCKLLETYFLLKLAGSCDSLNQIPTVC